MVHFFLHKDVRNLVQPMSTNKKNKLKGTGVYLLPDPAKGALGRQSVRVKGLSYEEAYVRAIHCIEATWIPDEILANKKKGPSPDGCGSSCGESGDCDITSDCVFCNPFSGCE